jgi:hypothetical protein
LKQPIPSQALDKHIAFLGATGSGKTSAAKSGVVEPSLEAGERVLMIDPTGAWWGLRVGANGKSKGYPIYIFGGDHGDYPLRAKDAAVLAEAFGTSSDSAIFDTSQMTVTERTTFFTEFAETIRRKNRGPLKLIIDEAHLFMPQAGAKVGGGVPAMLHAGNNLVSLARSKGLRITLISQRPAKLHKDSLTQVQSMVAMRLMAPQDRKAVSEWIADQADAEKGKEIVASLPSLKPGEAWVWAPEVNVLNRVTFALPKTFDSSRAPDDRDGVGPQLSPINLDALKGRLGAVEAETKANDPKELRKRIADLEAAARKVAPAPANDPEALAKAEKRGFEQAERKLSAAAEAEVQRRTAEFLAGLGGHIENLAGYLKENGKALKARPSLAIEFEATPAGPVPRAPAPVSRPAQAARPRPANGEASPISNSEQRIVDAIRWWNVLGIPAPSHAQVAFIAGYSHKSGTWATYLSRLRSAGMIEGRGDLVLTDEGGAVATEPAAPPTREALHAAVMNKIDAPLQRILSPLLNAYPDALSHQDCATMAGYSYQSGTWATYLSRLRSLDLIAGRGELKAEPWLFAA